MEILNILWLQSIIIWNVRQIAENLLAGYPVVGEKCVSKSLAASRYLVHDERILYCMITWQFYETTVNSYTYKWHMVVCTHIKCEQERFIIFGWKTVIERGSLTTTAPTRRWKPNNAHAILILNCFVIILARKLLILLTKLT